MSLCIRYPFFRVLGAEVPLGLVDIMIPHYTREGFCTSKGPQRLIFATLNIRNGVIVQTSQKNFHYQGEKLFLACRVPRPGGGGGGIILLRNRF